MSALNFNIKTGGDDSKPQISADGKLIGGKKPASTQPQNTNNVPTIKPPSTPAQQSASTPQQPYTQTPTAANPIQSQTAAPVQQSVQQSPTSQVVQQQKQQQIKPTVPKSMKEQNKKKKGGLFGKKNKPINDTPAVMDEEYVKKAYNAYRSRRVIVFASLIIGVVGLLGFAAYNVFKPTLSIGEAERGALYVVDKSQRNWDSGVQSFLQRNLHDILAEKFQSTSAVKRFTVDNISVERNIIIGSGTDDAYSPIKDLFLCYFSADLTANDNTTRVYFEMPIKVDATSGDGFKQAGDITLTVRKPYSDNAANKEDKHETLKFQEDKEDTKTANELKQTLNNFFTLAYNDNRHDVSDYYTGTNVPLKFNGKFTTLTTCKYYTEPNQLGYNTYVTYNLELPNGLTFETSTYLKVEKTNNSFVIKDIL